MKEVYSLTLKVKTYRNTYNAALFYDDITPFLSLTNKHRCGEMDFEMLKKMLVLLHLPSTQNALGHA